MILQPAYVVAPVGPRPRRGKTLYVILCIMGELMGLSMVFLQFYGANKLTRGEYAWYRFYDDYSYDSYGESMAAYGYCLPLTTGLLVWYALYFFPLYSLAF